MEDHREDRKEDWRRGLMHEENSMETFTKEGWKDENNVNDVA